MSPSVNEAGAVASHELVIDGLRASVEGREILQGVDLVVELSSHLIPYDRLLFYVLLIKAVKSVFIKTC